MNAYLIHNGSSIMDIFIVHMIGTKVAFAESLRRSILYGSKKYNINLSKTYFIGDDIRDEVIKNEVANFLWSTKKA